MYDIPGFDISAVYGEMTQLHYARGNRTGSFNERTMLMINGVEANILFAQLMNLSFDFPLSSIKQIEIIYGPASAIYGPNVFSGIINIITENPVDLSENSNKIYARSGIGSNTTRFADMTYVGNLNPVSVLFSYRRFRSELFDISGEPGFFANGTIIGNEDIWGPYVPFYPKYQNLANDHALLGKLSFKGIEVGYNQLFTQHGNGSTYPYDKTLPTTNWTFKRDIFYVKANHDLTENFRLSFLSSYQNCGVLPFSQWAQGWNDSASWSSQRTVEFLNWKYMSSRWAVFQDFEYRPFDWWTINGGVKYSYATYQKSYENGRSDRTIWTPGTQWTNPQHLFPLPMPYGPLAGNTFDENENGAFVQSKTLFLDRKLALIAGLRYDNNTNYGDVFSPRAGITYFINDKILVKSNYGTGFQTPAPRNLYGSWGGLTVNENLKPDRIQSVDLGVNKKFSKISVEATAFYNEITNSIMQGQNLPTKNIYGMEWRINYVFPTLTSYIRNAYLHFNYSYILPQYSQMRTNSTTNRQSDRVGDIAPHKFNLVLNFDAFNYTRFNIRMNYVGERETEISNPIEKVDAYFVTNLSVQLINVYQNKINFFFNINNLFDTKYYHPGLDAADAGEDVGRPSAGWYSSRLPQPERMFMFGLSLNL